MGKAMALAYGGLFAQTLLLSNYPETSVMGIDEVIRPQRDVIRHIAEKHGGQTRSFGRARK
jgi:hypothetical protein